MEGKIHGKQIVNDTVLKSLNGSPGSTQYLIPSNDANITLDIISPTDSSTHSFVVGWQGQLPLDRGGLNNTVFVENELLITNSDSVVSSGFLINDDGVSDKDIWTANRIIKQISSNKIIFNVGDGLTNTFNLSHNLGTRAVIVQIFDTETGESVETEVVRTDENSVEVSFNKPPDTEKYCVVIS